MFDLFGVYDFRKSPNEISEHRQSIDIIRNKFPKQTKHFQLIQRGKLMVFGASIQTSRIGDEEIFFSGEIYNLAELNNSLGHSQSGSQKLASLILKLLMEEGLTGLALANGQFNILIYNHSTKSLKIINDQMGIRQVYYHAHADFLLFGSELKFLLSHPQCPKEIDWQKSLKRPIPFVVLNTESHYNAWFKDVEMMEEAQELTMHPDAGMTFVKYWNPYQNRNNPQKGSKTAAQCESEYMALLEDAVKIRSSSADSACSMLSGGLDSSIISAIAAKQQKMHTYSIVTQATFQEKSTQHCQQLAQDLSLRHRQVVYSFDSVVKDADLWKKRIWRSESPVVHKDAIGKTLLHAAVTETNPSIRHIMTGTGSDQMNGGLVRWIAGEEKGQPGGNWKNILQALQDERLKPFLPMKYDALWGGRELLQDDFLMPNNTNQTSDELWDVYLKSCLHGNQFSLLWDENRAGYTFDRNVRYPFLDFRFLTFALSVPQELHQTLFYDKGILRRPAQQYLPPVITNSPKAPSIPGKKDKRIELYKKIISSNNRALLDEIFAGPARHVIDRTRLENKIETLIAYPDILGWEYVMNIINIAILGQLPFQDESSMDYESDLMKHVDVIESTDKQSNDKIRKLLQIPPADEMTKRPLSFAPGCTITIDAFTDTTYIVQDESLVYELDHDYPEWKTFLLAIDGSQSALEICRKNALNLSGFLAFLELSVAEEILIYTTHNFEDEEA